MKSRTIRLVLAGVALALLTVAAFVRCWDYGLINLDDYHYIGKPFLFTWPSVASVKAMFLDVEESIWMPLTWLSYAIDNALFGRWYGGFHLHSLLVHAVNACLVWVFLRGLFRDRLAGSRFAEFAVFSAALAWAAHPLRCESAVFIASRKDVLSFFWEILALIAWLRGSLADGWAKRVRLTVLATVLFVIGSMCKPSVMTFPVLCLIVDFLIVRKVRFFRYIVPCAYMLFLGWFAAWQQGVAATADFAAEPLVSRVIDACAAFGIYVRNTVWPQWLALQCMKRWPDPPMFMWPGVAISALWGFILLRKARALWDARRTLFVLTRFESVPAVLESGAASDPILAGLAWFAVAIAPMLGLANFGYHAFADRFTYIPAVGLSIAAVAGLLRLREFAGAKAAVAVSSACVVGLMAATWRQTGFWKDDLTVFTRTLEVDGDWNACAHGVIANWYFEFPHDIGKCVEHFRKADRSNFGCILGSVELYVMALAEAGEADRIPEVMHRYEETLERNFGRDTAMGIMGGQDLDLAAKYGYFRTVYRASKVAWWLTDPATYGLAGDLLKEIERQKHLKGDTIWLYLRWQYYDRIGDRDTAAKLHHELLFGEKPPVLSQFRFLRQKDQRR